MKCLRRTMTLLELLISMGLAMLLLTALTYFYSDLGALHRQAEKQEDIAFQMRYLESRLSTILPATLSERDLKDNFFFFTSGDLHGLLAPNNPSLVFVFDGGVNFNEQQVSQLLGRLYLDQKQRFCLATWPVHKEWDPNRPPHPRKEVLLEGVEHVKFEFFMAPQKDRSLVNKGKKTQDSLEKTLIPSGWRSDWRQENGMLPAMMKIEITLIEKDEKTGDPLRTILAFPLPKSPQLIVYGDHT